MILLPVCAYVLAQESILATAKESLEDFADTAAPANSSVEFLQMKSLYLQILANPVIRPECGDKRSCSSPGKREICSTAVTSIPLEIQEDDHFAEAEGDRSGTLLSFLNVYLYFRMIAFRGRNRRKRR